MYVFLFENVFLCSLFNLGYPVLVRIRVLCVKFSPCSVQALLKKSQVIPDSLSKSLVKVSATPIVSIQ